MCGENAALAGITLVPNGSSPRVRGKQARTPVSLRDRGLIPACAGKTPSRRAGPPTWRAHPRVCGENPVMDQPPGPALGSSPRVRGKRVRLLDDPGEVRLIPACAGKTSPMRTKVTPRAAHPRVCGENLLASALAAWWLGSSPRVRGKPPRLLSLLLGGRLIPACAGKTARRRGAHAARTAHPRVCGENYPRFAMTFGKLGSSPRVRGKRSCLLSPFGLVGLIPACAGKTAYSSTIRARRRAHPRVCGENDTAAASSGTASGSSPRVRGKRRCR